MKGKYSQSGKGVFLRKLLVTAQLAATVALIIGSFVVYRQIRFVNNQDLGMNLSQVLIIKPPILTEFDSSFISHENSFKAELNQIPGITGTALPTGWRVMNWEGHLMCTGQTRTMIQKLRCGIWALIIIS